MNDFVLYAGFDVILSVIEIYCAYYLYRNTERRERHRAYFLLAYGFLVVCKVAMGYLQIPLAGALLAGWVLLALVSEKLYRIKYTKAFVYSAFFYLILFLSEILVVRISEYLIYDTVRVVTGGRDFIRMEIDLLVTAVSFIFIVLVERYYNEEQIGLERKETASFLLNAAITLTIIIVMRKLADFGDEGYVVFCTISSLILLCSFIYQTVTTNFYLDEKRREQQEEIARYELKIKSDYYQRKLEDEEQVRTIYHDLHNHLLILEDGIAAEQEEAAMSQLKEHFESYDAAMNTGSEFLDIILADKCRLAARKGIAVRISEICPECGMFGPLDISTIFGNLLDNAIEACEKVQLGEPTIHVKCFTKGKMLFLVFQNPISEQDDIDISRSSKEDQFRHGLGIKNVRNAVNKYGGECNAEVKESEFIFSIACPFAESVVSSYE